MTEQLDLLWRVYYRIIFHYKYQISKNSEIEYKENIPGTMLYSVPSPDQEK